jgi:hypothetical protein
MVKPDGVTDDYRWETVASERRDGRGAGGHKADPTLPPDSTCQCPVYWHRGMLFQNLLVSADEFEARTGWQLQPEGLCRDDVCTPLPAAAFHDGLLDLASLAELLGMPLLHDAEAGLWALGPPAADHALTSAQAPDLVLPDVHGQALQLGSLRGKKVLLLAWASW